MSWRRIAAAVDAVGLDAVIDIAEQDLNDGLCIYCHAMQSGVEPDAQRYSCEACERPGVFGVEFLLLASC